MIGERVSNHFEGLLFPHKVLSTKFIVRFIDYLSHEVQSM